MSAAAARDLYSTSSNCAIATATPPGSLPVTIACWYKPRTVGTAALVAVDHSSSGNLGRLVLVCNSGNQAQASHVADSGSSGTGTSSVAAATNQWGHFAAVFASSASRTGYLNGSGVTETTSLGATTVNQIQIGARNIYAVRGVFANGVVAHIAVWRVALTSSEIGQLSGFGNPSRAVHPRWIRPEALVYCPELDIPNLVVPDRVAGSTTWSNSPPFVVGPTVRR